MTTSAIGQKVWNYCNVLRDAGLSYGDYLEQITFLIFLKMMDERSRPPFTDLPGYTPAAIPEEFSWPSLVARDGEALEEHYTRTLEELGNAHGLLGQIFRKAQNRIHEPAMLKRLVSDLIDKVDWSAMGADVKGAIYEELLERNAQDVKTGAGQYFTPRALISAIVACMRPEPDTRICDPAAGTGGFLLAAHDSILDRYPNLSRDQRDFLQHTALQGWEIVDTAARMCAMNLYLHGIGRTDGEETLLVHVEDSLLNLKSHFQLVLTNPPFGRKSSLAISNGEGAVTREDQTVIRDEFWATTSNKQLNFLQLVRSILEQDGRAAIVVPDNVLFEGGAGETIRRKLLHECDVHTLLRLPTGIFYAQGVKANVLFFDRRIASETPWTKTLWIYDLRTNKHFTLKTKQMTRTDLDDFVACYNPDNRHERQETDRFHAFQYDELVKRDKANLDIFWLRDESVEDSALLPEPDVLADEIVQDLQAALEQFAEIGADLGADAGEEVKRDA